MHANSTKTGGGPEARGGRAASAGCQSADAQRGADPPRTKTVAIGEASRGAVDSDGFVEVRATARLREAAGGAAAAAGEDGTASGGTDGRRPAQGSGDDGQGQDHAADHDREGEEEPAQDQGPSEDDLRGYWEAAKELLAYTKKQGYAPEHPVRRNAELQVANTLADWRAARPPKAIHARMGWAEEALQRAKKAQARAEQELDDLDRQYEADRERMLDTLHAARAKTRERAQALADLSREAADEYQGEDPPGNPQGAQLLHGAYRTLDTEIGPAVEAVLGAMDQGSEHYSVLSAALAKITTLHSALGIAAGGEATDYYDMAVDDNEAAAQPPAAGAETVGGDGMDTAPVRAPRWLEAKRGGEHDPASTTGTTPPRWKKGRAEGGGAGDGGAGTPTDEPRPNPGQSAAGSASSGAADPVAERRRQVIAQAQNDGIDFPIEYVQQLCPEALEEWAKEHLL